MHKLGFGMMRLPLLDPKQTSQIDVPQVSAMADAFLAQGFTYFDTAYGYHGGESEHAVREAVVRRHDRSAFALADKIRDDLKARGIVLEDTPQGVKWHTSVPSPAAG